jgi:hypothetical protein
MMEGARRMADYSSGSNQNKSNCEWNGEKRTDFPEEFNDDPR